MLSMAWETWSHVSRKSVMCCYNSVNFIQKYFQWTPRSSSVKYGVYFVHLTHWGQVTHICVNKLTIIGSDNGLLPGRCQAIIWTNAGILLIGPLGTNFIEISIKIHSSSFNKMHGKMPSRKFRPFCLSLNLLKSQIYVLSVAQNQRLCHTFSKRGPETIWDALEHDYWRYHKYLLHPNQPNLCEKCNFLH